MTDDELKCGSMLKFMGMCGLLGGLASAAYQTRDRGETESSTTYHYLDESRYSFNEPRKLENIVDVPGNVLSNLYSADVANYTTLGVTHDLAGVSIALLAGMGNVRHKLLALGTAFSVAYFPEAVNIYNEMIVGSQVFTETGKDIACVLGAYLFGKVISGFRRNDNISSRISSSSRKIKGRSWWNS